MLVLPSGTVKLNSKIQGVKAVSVGPVLMVINFCLIALQYHGTKHQKLQRSEARTKYITSPLEKIIWLLQMETRTLEEAEEAVRCYLWCCGKPLKIILLTKNNVACDLPKKREEFTLPLLTVVVLWV